MNSVDHSLVSRLVCPAIRIKEFIVDNSYYYSDVEDGESSQRHHLLPLIGCNNKETGVKFTNDTTCGACFRDMIGTTYYMCNECDKWYHKECVESPPVFKSLIHRKHSLELQNYSYSVFCHRCTSIGKGLLYYCDICDINLDPVCARKPSFINHQKRHEHTLYIFPRKPTMECNVCGLQNDMFLIFACIQCDFFVHENCIYAPSVIKISRHKHRLTFAYSLTSGECSCEICSEKINEIYGTYSCMKKDCIYVAHVNCATEQSTWDGKDLEGKPEEEEDIIEPPFEKVNDETILHFSHLEHPMRFEEDFKILYDDEYKYCLECMLPLYDGKAYICTHRECGFVLHEACAYLSRVKQYALHAHSLTLEPHLIQTNNPCVRCYRDCFGFKYVCYNGCKNFSLDVRCASISEPSYHDSHSDHPLLMFKYVDEVTCSICHLSALSVLHCSTCDFYLCFYCATLPYKMRYKNDEHLLILSYDQNNSNGIYYWCDLCEETLNPSYGIYRCNECEVTLHTECALGSDLYMNPSSTITLRGKEFKIVENYGLTRPICIECRRRCQYRTFFIATDSGDIYCSIRDIYKGGYKRRDSLVDRLLNITDLKTT